MPPRREDGLGFTWVAGASGHPKGQTRRGRSVADLLRQVGSERILFPPGAGDAVAMTRREAAARVIWSKALFDGDLAASKLLIETLDGKPGEAASPGLHFTADDLARAEVVLVAGRAAMEEGAEDRYELMPDGLSDALAAEHDGTL